MDNQLGNTPIQKVIEGYLILQQMIDNDILKEVEGLYAINGDGAIKFLEKQNLEFKRENEQLSKYKTAWKEIKENFNEGFESEFNEIQEIETKHKIGE